MHPDRLPDFWPTCGYTLLTRNPHGWLIPTEAWLQRLYARPELALIEDSCAAERALHAALQREPARPVPTAQLAALRDADARENWGHVLAFRDALLSAGSLEGWLLALFRSGDITLPPVFIDHVVQTIMRGMLDNTDDAFVARAAELMFRPQRISRHKGRLLAGDQQTLDLQHETGGFGDLGRLLAQAQMPLKATQLQVLSAGNADDGAHDRAYDNRPQYWQDALSTTPRHAFLLDLTHAIKQELGHGITFHLTHAHSGLRALASVLEWWVQHLLGVPVTVQPLQRIDDAQWRWHVGLDAQASALLDDLYQGRAIDEERLSRLVSLFRLDFTHAAEMRGDVAGKPVYLGLMTTADGVLRMKPQNLLLNLPLARQS